MKSAPCKDCKTRQMHCHSTCEKYIQWRREADADHDAMIEGKKLNSLDYVSGTKGTRGRRQR